MPTPDVPDVNIIMPGRAMVIGVIIAAATFLLRVWLNERSERRRKKELVNAVYHHVDEAIDRLEGKEKWEEMNITIRNKIEKDASYTPYFVRSSASDLTYDHIIGVMEWLDETEEKSVASCFYTQSSLHAVEESFNLEHVRSWSSSRKLQLWEIYAEYREKVLRDALGARKTLRRIMDKKY